MDSEIYIDIPIYTLTKLQDDVSTWSVFDVAEYQAGALYVKGHQLAPISWWLTITGITSSPHKHHNPEQIVATSLVKKDVLCLCQFPVGY